MLNNLDETIQNAINTATSGLGREIARAVRQAIAAELVGAAPVAVKRGPGRPPKSASVAAAGGPAPKARRKGRRRVISQAEISQVLDVLKKKPGLTSVQIQKAAGIDAKQAARVLTKLRNTGVVKTKGQRSAASYTVA
jgi:hypothetical protein